MSDISPVLAVIDLGTNTFHLLICAQNTNGQLQELYRERRFVKLAEGGIQQISPVAYQRAQAALLHFRHKMDAYRVTSYRALATAALRTAKNGEDFIKDALRSAQITIELISGKEEARLISEGVQLALKGQAGFCDGPSLIMDIGGGSVEFIIRSGRQTVFSQSFPVGVAVLYREFHQSEPITANQILELQGFLSKELNPLAEVLEQAKVRCLIGAAGVFDVLAEQLTVMQPTLYTYLLNLEAYQQLHERLVTTDLATRLAMPEVPANRGDMMVVASLLIQFVLELSGVKSVLVSSYAMKEGALSEMFSQGY